MTGVKSHPVGMALRRISYKLATLNARQVACGLPRLQEADMTWGERTMELQARVRLLEADGPSMDLLAALGAHVTAYMVALDRAELARVDSGEAA
jgi:hypothetical protein